MVEMEKQTGYTCNPEYMAVYNEKIAAQADFITSLQEGYTTSSSNAYGYRNVVISHLRKYDVQLIRQAFEMRMRITAYWSIVLQRIVDCLALYLQFSVKKFVNIQFDQEINEVFLNAEVEKLLEESPSVASKRDRLKKSIKLLEESKDDVSTILDR